MNDFKVWVYTGISAVMVASTTQYRDEWVQHMCWMHLLYNAGAHTLYNVCIHHPRFGGCSRCCARVMDMLEVLCEVLCEVRCCARVMVTG